MSWIDGLLSGICVIGSMAWIVNLVHMARHRDRAVFLAALGDEEPGGGWPSVAVIFGARDESAMVGAATRSMLGQDYPAMEVIAVDDRSGDATGAILDEIAREDRRLRVVHVVDLPPGWLGKTHAMETGARASGADWLLFTDADVIFRPGTLRRAIAFAVAEGLDHITVGPEVPAESPGERMFLSLFGLLFAMHAPLGKLDDRRSKAHAGIGAFNLVRVEAFRSIGGLRRLALSVDDDMRLGQALKFAGYRMRFLLGLGAVSVRWQVGLWGMVRGLEKNVFAAMGFSLVKAAGGVAVLTALGIGPYAGLCFGPWWARVICGLGVAAIAAMLLAVSKQSRIGWYYSALIPVATVVMILTMARSVALTIFRGGVRWRGHLYPLRELKDHVRRRDEWIREVWLSTR